MRRHDLDPVSLMFGLLFTLVGLAFLTGEVDVTRLDLRSSLPALAIGAGVLIVLQAVHSTRNDGET